MAPLPDPRTRHGIRLIFAGFAVLSAALLALGTGSGRDAAEGVTPRATPAAPSTSASGEAFALDEDLQNASIASVGRREPGGCAVVFDADDAHVSEEAVLLAMLEPSGRADCRGHAPPPLATVAPRPVVRLDLLRDLDEKADGGLDARGLGSSVVARVALGTERRSDGSAPCAGEAGFIAVLLLRGRRLGVEAIGPWSSPCAALEPPTFATVDGVAVLFEDDGETTELGEQSFQRAWAWRSRSLERAGDVWTERALDDRSMRGELTLLRGSLFVDEAWTPNDGGAEWNTRRAYRWGDGRLRPQP